MKILRKAVILAHRYLGVILSLMVMMWFATGITMMYAGGMPRVTPELRLERLAPLDLSRVRLSVAEAAERADVDGSRGRATMLTVLDRPAYRFDGRDTTTVFADSGEVLDDLSIAQSRGVASRFAGVSPNAIQHIATLYAVDQWTLVQSRQLPLHKFRVEDAAATELYVQPTTGEVVMQTTRRSRALAWVSTIPHWLYFAALRTNQPLWYRIVVWTSALVCVLAVLGLVLAVTQFRRTRPFRLAAAIPYAGPMRWHYVTGAVFGVFTLTFAFSGMLSMEPFAWTNAAGLQVPRTTFSGGALDLARFPRMDPEPWRELLQGGSIKELEFARIQDEPYYIVRHSGPQGEAKKPERLHQPYYVTGRAEANRLMVRAGDLEVRRDPFSAASLVARLEAAIPDAKIVESETLSEYDSYYYSRRAQTPLPVLRVKFDDPGQTWVYIDPATTQVLSAIPRLARVERWLYNGLHSLDFAFWYTSPVWDVGMIALCLGGFTTSSLGLFLGLKRARRLARRATASAGEGRPISVDPSTATR
jgi:uncharacterized iron-regulated membrane protein